MRLHDIQSIKLRFVLCMIPFVVGLVVDQFTKYLARTLLVEGQPVVVVPHLFTFDLLYNFGAAFGLGAGHIPLFVACAVLVTACGIVYLIRAGFMPFILLLGISLVFAGAIGNVIDRILFGRVTDFIALTFMSFPIFNVADIFVTLGIAITCFTFIFATKK